MVVRIDVGRQVECVKPSKRAFDPIGGESVVEIEVVGCLLEKPVALIERPIRREGTFAGIRVNGRFRRWEGQFDDLNHAAVFSVDILDGRRWRAIEIVGID